MLMAEIKSPKDAAMMSIVLADSVYTPARAHMRWGSKGDAACVGLYRVIGCATSMIAHTHRDRKMRSGYRTVFGTRAMCRWASYKCQEAERWVRGLLGVLKIQWNAEAKKPHMAAASAPKGPAERAGAYLGEKETRGTGRAQWSDGVQTAARAEATAVAQTLTIADDAITIITDNNGVWSKLRKLQRGQQVMSL